MRSIVFLLLLVVITGNASAQNTFDWKILELKGKVKSVTVQQDYRYKKNGTDFTPWEKQYTTIYQFNANGRYSEYRQLLANGSQNYKITYSYTPKAKTGEQAYFDKADKPTIKKSMLYDDKGKLLELIEYSKDGNRVSSYKYQYDAAGNNTTLTYYKEDGTMGSKTTWVYNAMGKATEMSVETPGYANSYKKYVYDAKGNLTEETWLDGRKQTTLRFIRTYNDKGNMTEEVKYKGDNTSSFDKTTWQYEYDKQGNWTKKTQYTSDGADFNIEKRTIVYY